MGQQQHDHSQYMAWVLTHPWRTGRKVQRNIYAMCHDNADNQMDVLIGQMDTGALAAHVVEVHNRDMEPR